MQDKNAFSATCHIIGKVLRTFKSHQDIDDFSLTSVLFIVVTWVYSTSFPGSPGAREGGKVRGPGNEVGVNLDVLKTLM